MTIRINWFLGLFVGVSILFLALGCGGAQAPQKGAGQARASRPILPPAQLDASVEQVLKEHPNAEAEEFLRAADSLKVQRDFEEAAAHYLAALKRKPGLTMATYQLACNYALWGRKEAAQEWLKKAVDAGFWGYEMMRDDDDLESIQKSQEFQTLLAQVKERYPAEALKHVGGSLLEAPMGDAPKTGWPVILFLHGYGDRKESYVPLARIAAENQFVGIAVSGPVVQYENRFCWPTDSFEVTHEYLKQELQKHKDTPLDKSRVFLLGLSQGAEHAGALVALHPEAYAGAIALSPGGRTDPPATLRTTGPARPLYVTVGRREMAGNKQLAKLWADQWRKAGWPVREETHPAGHQIPRGWDAEFPKVLQWLLSPN